MISIIQKNSVRCLFNLLLFVWLSSSVFQQGFASHRGVHNLYTAKNSEQIASQSWWSSGRCIMALLGLKMIEMSYTTYKKASADHTAAHVSSCFLDLYTAWNNEKTFYKGVFNPKNIFDIFSIDLNNASIESNSLTYSIAH